MLTAPTSAVSVVQPDIVTDSVLVPPIQPSKTCRVTVISVIADIVFVWSSQLQLDEVIVRGVPADE
jgi:hypothetical protein